MPVNDFAKSDIIGPVIMERLRRELILPRLVRRMGLADFQGRRNDTINVRVPTIAHAREYEWRTRNNPIVVDDLEELTIPAVLNRHIYHGYRLTDENLTLDLFDFSVQVLEPQLITVAENLEAILADTMVNADYAHPGVTYQEDADSDGANFHKAAVDARKVLNDYHVPMNGRVIALGSSVEAAALKEEGFRRANESGSTDALRNAIIGNVAGFTVIGNVQSLPEDFAIAFHPSAFVFANVAPVVPSSVTGVSVAQDGLAMRWIQDYDANHLTDRSVVSSFAGANSVADGRDDHGDLTNENVRAVLINFSAAGS